MPIPCFQMHVIHLWYCQVPKYSNTWCIFRKYVATVLCYSTFRAEVMMDDSNSREPVDWRLCILCQESNTNKGAVVLNPRTESYQKILDVLAEPASVHNGQYIAIQRRLKGYTKEMLVDKELTWHRSCCSYATNQTELQRARDRFDIQWPQDSMLWKGDAIKDQP